MTESEIQLNIIKACEAAGCIVLRMNAGHSGRHNVRLCQAGTPDLLVIHHDGVLWVEVKTKTGKLNDSQNEMHNKLEGMGHYVIVARCVDDVMGALKEIGIPDTFGL